METFRKRLSGRVLLGVVGGLLVGCLIVAGAEPPAGPKNLALIGGEILTQTDAGPVHGTILIRNGKIAAVGRDVAVPADAEKIDVTGFVITPGLIDAQQQSLAHRCGGSRRRQRRELGCCRRCGSA